MSKSTIRYEITPARPADAKEIGLLRAEGWYEQYGSLPGIDIQWIEKEVIRITSNDSTEQRSLAISASLNPESSHFWRVVRRTEDNFIIGFIDARRLSDGRQEIHSIHVQKQYRNQGIGQLLMNATHEWFDQTKPIFVDVAVGNKKAQEFYTRKPNNYKPTGYIYHYEKLSMMRLQRG